MKKGIKIGYEVGTGEEVKIKPSHIIVTGITQESGKCLTGDDEILTIEGKKIKVEDAFKSREIIKTVSLNENFKLIEDTLIDVSENGLKKVYLIELDDGRKTKLTAKHPVFTIEGWRPVKELKKGEYIAVPRTLELIKNNFKIPDSALKIIAYMIAEGAMTINKGSAGFTTSNPLIAKDLNNALKKHGLELYQISKIEYRIRQLMKYKHPFKKTGQKKGRGYGYWRHFCKIYGLKRLKSKEKEIPKIIFKSSKDNIRLFLNRLFAGDGCYTKGKEIISYASTSKKLLLDVQHLLLRFGIKSRFREKPELFIVKADTERFLQEIGMFQREFSIRKVNHVGTFDIVPTKIPTLKRYKDHWIYAGYREGYPSRKILKRYAEHTKNKYLLNLADSDMYWVKIKSINFLSKEMTYDVTTESTGNLVVNDIFVHNTTTLNALIKRGKFKAVIFKTKIGEKGITEGRIIPPYYKDEFDWEYAKDLLEASRKEKLKFETAWIITYSKGANNLFEFKKNIDEAIPTLREGLNKNVLITLQAYLEKILPELQFAPLSNTLDIGEGVSIMDLERFKEETQSLIIRSVLKEVLRREKNTVIVLPEGWRYIPQGRGNPVKRDAEAFIRQGAANNNFLWIDSQDITGIEKTILKQVSTWILGYQREFNEIKRTLDQLPIPKKDKPTSEDIATLKVGHFYVATSNFTKKVYVQPSWMDSKTAKKIATGEIDVNSVKAPESISPFSIATPTTEEPQAATIDLQPIRKEINELRTDFFNKIQQQQEAITKLYTDIYNLQKNSQKIDEDLIVGKVLQKINIPAPNNIQFNEEELIQKIVARIPKGGGNVVYEVAPLEKITKDFLEQAKNKILNDITTLSQDEKKTLKYIESRGAGVKAQELITKCFYIKEGGSARNKASKIFTALGAKELVRKDTSGARYPHLKQRIKALLEVFNATDQEIEQVYNHIIMEMLE